MALLEQSIISPILVGRNQEIATLERALRSAQKGNGQTLLIAGDAGVGKSRLLSELAGRATALGFSVMQGHCFEQDAAFPYSLWVDTMRSHFAQSNPVDVSAAFGPFAVETLKLLPELVLALPDLQPAPALDPEIEKRRLFEALIHFIANGAKSRPLLLVTEDVHWSDKSSLDFLYFFIRRASTLPVLLLITYRRHEVSATLQHFLAQLDRGRLAQEILLTPLSRTEVKQMVGAILQSSRPLHFDVLDAIYAFSEGNAFFVEEILKLLIAAGELQPSEEGRERKPRNELHIPRSVVDTVQRRAAHLSAEAQNLLALAAVIGRRFEFAMLQALVQLSEQALLPYLKELIVSQLVIEESAEHFAFRHALTREAVYASLLRRERKQYHLLVTETMTRLYSPTLERHLGELAYHACEAGLWQEALDYSQRAGSQAQSLYAAREAIVHFTRAVESARQMGQSPSAEVLRARGKAYETAGDFDLARADFEQSLNAARQRGDGVAHWQALMDLGFLWAAHDYQRTGDYFDEALILARTLNQITLVAHSLNRVGNWYANVAQPQVALNYHQESLALFTELDDRRGLAETYDLLGMTLQLSSDLVQSYRAYQHAISLWQALQDQLGIISSLAALPLCSTSYLKHLDLPALSLDEASRAAKEARQIAQEIDWRAGEAFASMTLTICLGSQGKYKDAMEAAFATLRCAEEIEHHQWIVAAHSVLGILYLDLLDFDEARIHLEQALTLAQAVGSLIWSDSTASYLASTYTAIGWWEQATNLLDEKLASTTPMQMQGERLSWYALAEALLARGNASAAMKIVEQLVQETRNLTQTAVIPRLWLLHGKCLTALSNYNEAAKLLQAAHQAAEQQDTRPLQWRILVALGKNYQAQARRAEAEQSFAAAIEIIHSLASNVPDDELRHNFLQRAKMMLPSPSTPTLTQIAKQEFGGLTAHDREVALLLAQGRSDQEIADVLVIGVRAVEAHITRILNKLDFTSRVQIAAWVVKKGFAPENAGDSP